MKYDEIKDLILHDFLNDVIASEEMKVAKSPSDQLARTNCVFVRSRDLPENVKYVLVQDEFAFAIM